MPIRIVMLTLFVSLSSKTLAQAPFTFEHDWGTVSIRVSAANDASLTSVYLDALQGGTTILDVTVPAEGTVTNARSPISIKMAIPRFTYLLTRPVVVPTAPS